MHELTISQLWKFIPYVALQLKEPLYIEGTFGIGKSEGVTQVATANPNDFMIDIRLSQRDSVDLRGLPGLETFETGTPKNKIIVRQAEWFAPGELPFVGNPKFAHIKGTIWLVLDEINAGSLPTLAAAYQLVNDRGIGSNKLMDNVVIIAMGNLATDKGVVNRMPIPLLNRFVQVRAVVSAKDFIAHHQTKGDLPPVAFAFYGFKPDLLHTYSPTSKDTVFSTPRTAAKAWRAWMTKEPEWMREAVMAGSVGKGVTAEIIGFVKIWETLKDYVPKIKADPVNVELPDLAKDHGLSLAYCVAVKLSGDMNAKNAGWIHTYLKRLRPAMTMMAWTLALRRDTALYQLPEYMDYAKIYTEAFSSAA